MLGNEHDVNLVNADSPSEAHSVERRKADLRVGGAREGAVKEELGQCREAVTHRFSVSLCPLARTGPPSSKQSPFCFCSLFLRCVNCLKNTRQSSFVLLSVCQLT